jgi:thiamine biosynthesis lipoprotein
VLTAGQELARETDGAFDLTVGPSVNLWRRVRRQKEFPTPEMLARMRERVGYTYLELNAGLHAARLIRPDMRLDAGGIAKGYALDEAMEVLRKRGIRQAMIEAGGDIVLGDPPPGRKSWQVSLPDIDSTGAAPVLELRNCALATSGDLFQFVEFDGIRYSHVVDPRSGIGITNRALVHVVAPRGMAADSLATAVSVLGSQAGLKLLARRPGTAGQITTGTGPDANLTLTPAFARWLSNP